MSIDLLHAAETVMKAVKETSDGSILRDDRDTWDPDAHIEITLSAKEIWALQDAIERFDRYA